MVEALPCLRAASCIGCAGVLEDMEAHGIECIDCYSVDNALVRLGDPVFAGFCHERDVDTGELAGIMQYRWVQLWAYWQAANALMPACGCSPAGVWGRYGTGCMAF